jgi:hypothetical protein
MLEALALVQPSMTWVKRGACPAGSAPVSRGILATVMGKSVAIAWLTAIVLVGAQVMPAFATTAPTDPAHHQQQSDAAAPNHGCCDDEDPPPCSEGAAGCGSCSALPSSPLGASPAPSSLVPRASSPADSSVHTRPPLHPPKP